MNVFDALQVSASGLSAQRLRLNLIAENIANVETTSTAAGGPYVRQEPVFAAMRRPRSFQDLLDIEQRYDQAEVSVVDVVEDPRPPIIKYMPGHPDADADGLVRFPNVNVFEEMVNMISAQRSYEANVTTVNAIKSMAMKALEIGK